ncbi:hypothetical protein Tco_0415628 [Tanacetum coccineum]
MTTMDDSPVEEMSPVKKPSKRASRAKKNDAKDKEPVKDWTKAEEIALCQAWCDVSANSEKGNSSSGFNLNDEADEYEEAQEHRPLGHDATKAKKKSSASSREGSSLFVIEQLMARSGMDLKMAELTMSSPNHSTSNIEDAFSSMNILNYTSISLDYFPTSSESSSFNSSEDSRDDYITPPAILTPSLVLTPSLLFDPRYFFVPEELLPPKKQIHSSSTTLSNSSRNQTCNLASPSFSVYTPTPPQIFEIGRSSIKMHLKHHEEQIEDILNYLDELSFHRIEKMEEGRINDRMIIRRNGNELKTKLKRIRTQIIKLQKKQLGQKDKIAFAHYRISNLEQIIEEIQARHQTDHENL